jgi:hypothetical protein
MPLRLEKNASSASRGNAGDKIEVSECVSLSEGIDTNLLLYPQKTAIIHL